jgi:hypothetical protein
MQPPTQSPNVVDAGWFKGAVTNLHPMDLVEGEYFWSINTLNRGGQIQTRPARKLVHSFQGQRAQGAADYYTMDNTHYGFVAIDGHILYSQFPFKMGFSELEGVSFSPNAERIFFCSALQAIEWAPEGPPAIAVMETPRKWLFIQDGISPPAWWNPYEGVFQPSDPTLGQTVPIGTIMAESGGRLWVVNLDTVWASDLYFPQSFNETTYIAELPGFHFPDVVTALLAGQAESDLFVGTSSGIYTLQSTILDRTKWSTTEDFQNIVSEEIGPVGPYTVGYQYGLPWFWTGKGLLSLDEAIQSNRSNLLVSQDQEMDRSKSYLGADLSGICLGFFGNALLCAVPSSHPLNRDTWVMDTAVAARLGSTAAPSWVGIWRGTYPVVFIKVEHSGVQHLFELSYSSGLLTTGLTTTGIHLWENFLPDTGDVAGEYETPINCAWESRMFVMPRLEVMRAAYVELLIVNLIGIVELDFFLTGFAGPFVHCGHATLRADQGVWGHPDYQEIYNQYPPFEDTIIQSMRAQVRFVRSNDIFPALGDYAAKCVEVGLTENKDKGFQVQVQWLGRMGVKAVKFFYDTDMSEPNVGQCGVDESTTPKIAFESERSPPQ